MRFLAIRTKFLVFAVAPAVLGTALMAGPLPRQDAQQQPAPDNTKTNKRDRDQSSPTADQKMNATDRDLAKRVRSAIIADKSLSTYAHNIKVVAQDGKVTLKGPVRSDEEKSAIETKATEVAGAGNVINQLEVAPKS
jgi:hyperosmotically inducible protein